ncbi:MAG: M1 family aminopeptidase [Terriglobales bacterium]
MRRLNWKGVLLAVAVALALVAISDGQGTQAVPPPPIIQRTPPPTPQTPAAPPLPQAPQAAYSVSHYDLNLNFNFPQHGLAVTAKLTITPRFELGAASFQLNRALNVSSISDAAGNQLGHLRQGDNVIVTFTPPLAANTPSQITVKYSGSLPNADLSPISGIRTAYVGPDGAFLLYPGEWFPTTNYDTGRFTADITATLPAGMSMVASGTGSSTAGTNGEVAWRFQQKQASFPGTVIVTPLKAQQFSQGGLQSSFYFSSDVPVALTAQYAADAAKIYSFLSDQLGTPPLTSPLRLVELPSDALPSFASPGLIVLSKTSIGRNVNVNLLVDEIAQQWFGVMLSPASLNDAWLQYGAARYCESLYIQHSQGTAAWQTLVQQLEVGALSYPSVALSNSSTLYVFSPQFQDMNYDKGAMLFHMLRWELGSQPFDNALRDIVNSYAWKPISTADFESALEKNTQSDLRSFFSQWYRGTAIPAFSDQYTVYRLQKGGYRVTGTLQQNLDLFNMPVEVAVETDGATATRTVPLSGTSGGFSLDMQDRPVKVSVDPNDWILKAGPELKLKVALSRGDNEVAAGDFPAAVQQYENALKVNPISSLAYYRLAQAYYQEENWQNAADAYRQAINGDLNPSWTEVWSYIQLGKIFDLTGQRNRALNQYQLAISTHDDTNNAQEVARQYMKTPYKAPPGVNTGVGSGD